MDPYLVGRSTLSTFEGIPTTQRLSRISSLQLPFEALEPYLIRPSEELDDPAAVTACIWSQELEDFDILYSWAALWRGMTYVMPLLDLNVIILIQCRTNLASNDDHCCTKVRSSHSSSETYL
jgi:hypothetical protein